MNYWTFLLTNIFICSFVSEILINGNLIHSLQVAVLAFEPSPQSKPHLYCNEPTLTRQLSTPAGNFTFLMF